MAVVANQRFIRHSNFLRPNRSARTPAGRVKRKNGSEATVAMSERKNGEGASVFIVHVAAVSWADTKVPEMTLATHSLLKTGLLNAVQVEV
jgi:hypothetical protein